MSTPIARREFLAGMAAMSAAHAMPTFGAPKDSNSPFRVAVINDEISQDFGHVCEVAARDFGMRWIELRSMWKKNIVALDEKEVAEARRIIREKSAESYRYCQPAIQGRLARCSQIEVQRGEKFQRRIRLEAAG